MDGQTSIQQVSVGGLRVSATKKVLYECSTRALELYNTDYYYGSFTFLPS
jgi:hypothetical protein